MRLFSIYRLITSDLVLYVNSAHRELSSEKKNPNKKPIQMSIQKSNLPGMNTQMPFRVMTHLPPHLASVLGSETLRLRTVEQIVIKIIGDHFSLLIFHLIHAHSTLQFAQKGIFLCGSVQSLAENDTISTMRVKPNKSMCKNKTDKQGA